jgi:hypothetical protein
MTDNQQDLEAELASLCPRSLSTESLRRIDDALCNAPQSVWCLSPRRLFLVAALAASFLVGVFLYRSLFPPANPTPNPGTIANTRPAPSPIHVASAEPFATLAAYRQAIALPEGAFDALLQKQAAISLRNKPNNKPLRAGLVSCPEWMN